VVLSSCQVPAKSGWLVANSFLGISALLQDCAENRDEVK
jgi:hypothetical protein